MTSFHCKMLICSQSRLIQGLGLALNKDCQIKQETLPDCKMHCIAGEHISS